MRTDLQHALFLRTFDDNLGFAPPNNPDAKVKHVLDVGTGTGIWALDFADEHPGADVCLVHHLVACRSNRSRLSESICPPSNPACKYSWLVFVDTLTVLAYLQTCDSSLMIWKKSGSTLTSLTTSTAE